MKKLLALLLILALFCACTPAAPSDTSSVPSETVSQETSSTDAFVAQPLTEDLTAQALEIIRLFGNPSGSMWTDPKGLDPTAFLYDYQGYMTYTTGGIDWAASVRSENGEMWLSADEVEAYIHRCFGLDGAAYRDYFRQRNSDLFAYTYQDTADGRFYRCEGVLANGPYRPATFDYAVTAVFIKDDVWKIDFLWVVHDEEDPRDIAMGKAVRLTVRVTDGAPQFLAYTDQNDEASFVVG